MTFFWVVFVFIPLYFVIGYCIARLRVPMSHVAAERWNRKFAFTTARDIQESVEAQFIVMLFVWPAYLPIAFLFSVGYWAEKSLTAAPARERAKGFGRALRTHLRDVTRKPA